MSGRLRWRAGGLRSEPLCCLEEEEEEEVEEEVEEEKVVESLAGGGCQGQEQARRAAIRLLESETIPVLQHTALSVWHGWAK